MSDGIGTAAQIWATTGLVGVVGVLLIAYLAIQRDSPFRARVGWLEVTAGSAAPKKKRPRPSGQSRKLKKPNEDVK